MDVRESQSVPINTEQISNSWLRKQDSPHEGFCSPSQTPYSPEGQGEFNVAQAEHPVSQKHTASHLAYCILSGPRVPEPYTCSLCTLADKHAHTNRHAYLLFIHASVTLKRQTVRTQIAKNRVSLKDAGRRV